MTLEEDQLVDGNLEEAGQVVLWAVAELAQPLPNARRAEAGLHAALVQAERDGVIQQLDAGMVAGALICARALDRAEALPDKTAVYAVAQVFPQFQRALHALRLPAEYSPGGTAPLPDPTPAAGGAPSWLSDELGPS